MCAHNGTAVPKGLRVHTFYKDGFWVRYTAPYEGSLKPNKVGAPIYRVYRYAAGSTSVRSFYLTKSSIYISLSLSPNLGAARSFSVGANTGDVIIASGTLSYLGPFTSEYRTRIADSWVEVRVVLTSFVWCWKSRGDG